MSIEINQKALNFSLENANKEKISLKNFTNKWIVLYFYPKDNTPGCTLEAKDFTCAIEDFAELNTVIIGISKDNIEKHLHFISKHNLKIELLSDIEHKVHELYDVWAPKKIFGKEYFGTIRTTFIINSDFEIVAKWDKVKVKNHINEVLKKLIELQNS